MMHATALVSRMTHVIVLAIVLAIVLVYVIALVIVLATPLASLVGLDSHNRALCGLAVCSQSQEQPADVADKGYDWRRKESP